LGESLSSTTHVLSSISRESEFQAGVKKISLAVPCQSTSLRPGLSRGRMGYGATVYG
jgi:hypothetical protein